MCSSDLVKSPFMFETKVRPQDQSFIDETRDYNAEKAKSIQLEIAHAELMEAGNRWLGKNAADMKDIGAIAAMNAEMDRQHNQEHIERSQRAFKTDLDAAARLAAMNAEMDRQANQDDLERQQRGFARNLQDEKELKTKKQIADASKLITPDDKADAKWSEIGRAHV